jgi:3-oxoacyl-[acyl-carrier protein] reductase
MSDTERLLNKVAIVTGSSRGIGKAIAFRFARAGARVVITYNRQREAAQEGVRQIVAEGGDAWATPLDVSSRRSIQEVFAACGERWGGIDILVNNAGCLKQEPFRKITDEAWDRTLAVNLKGVFISTQEVLPFFERKKSGCIINITSVGGQMGGPKAPHYSAAKAGVISLTKSTARLLAPMGVRVNAIAPGFIRTDIYRDIVREEERSKVDDSILLGRVGEPEEVADAALFLASDESGYITGHVINVNGGCYLGAGS